MLKHLIIILGSVVALNNCFAGELVTNATVLEVASNGSNGKNFAVRTEGGVGLCTGWILFPEAKAPSIATYNQTFSLATMALAAEKKVRIHNYTSNSCAEADFISVSN